MRGRSCRAWPCMGGLRLSKYMRAWLAVTLNPDAREWHAMDDLVILL